VLLCVSCCVSPCEFLRRDFYDTIKFTEQKQEPQKVSFRLATKEPGVSMFPPSGLRCPANRLSAFPAFLSAENDFPVAFQTQLAFRHATLEAFRAEHLFQKFIAAFKASHRFKTSETIEICIIITAIDA
jgi:hypothetical protein